MTTAAELRERHTDLAAKARLKIDEIKDDTPPERAAEIEREFDAMMDEHDAIVRRERIGRFEVRDGGDPRRPIGPDGSARGDGLDVEVETELRALRPEQRVSDWHTRQATGAVDEYRGLSLGGYLRSMVLGAHNETERRALAEGTDSAGGYTTPETLAVRLIDLMRAKTAVFQAGAMTVPLTSDRNYIAKVLNDPTPAWRAENAPVAVSEPTFGRVELLPKSLAVLVKTSRELLEDSVNLETALPNIIASALAVELDRVALFGSGTDPEPLGLVNTAGVGAVAHDAALANYAPLVAARTLILTANAPGVSAYIMHPRDEGVLAGLTDTQGQPLNIPPAIRDTPMLTTTTVPTDDGAETNESTIVAGAFQHLLVGIRTQIRIEVLRETFAGNLQYGFLAWLRADIAVEQPGAFCKITGITQAA